MRISLNLFSGLIFFQIFYSSIFCQKIIGKANFISQGDFYNGKVINGKREGFGIYKYFNGDVYEGYWKNDRKNGKGKFVY